MASSSVSQESLDMEDFENQAKRNRIRTHRGRGMIHRSAEREGSDQCEREAREQNGDHEKENNCASLSLVQTEHDSPTRGAANRMKDKRTRPNHLHKGKLPKDKRKLREKRRSTGVVHLPSTETVLVDYENCILAILVLTIDNIDIIYSCIYEEPDIVILSVFYK
ncbi:hypothetical protein LOTGIDRAFT_168300 [Lottia gigantea]|uniref:Uncharacterized protein n=1 Tax=Lottia gigantea TaxID=225164 RepID=V3Z2H9_LOTGI|nr:hypothetical protein LOTGIDRAFT_168300 [Lottia gigantea]ESO84813.1 hypothetical protein LOTGIDRAFT_168300 [Lottia gigantea]